MILLTIQSTFWVTGMYILEVMWRHHWRCVVLRALSTQGWQGEAGRVPEKGYYFRSLRSTQVVGSTVSSDTGLRAADLYPLTDVY